MKLWDLSGYSEKSYIQEAYLPKTSISGQIVSEILAQLCSDDSIQILLKKQFSIFLSHIRLQKQHSSLMYWLKICKAWVRSQGHPTTIVGKYLYSRWVGTIFSLGAPEESITLSMELAKTQSHEFEFLEDNYSLTISTQGCRINTGKFNTKGT